MYIPDCHYESANSIHIMYAACKNRKRPNKPYPWWHVSPTLPSSKLNYYMILAMLMRLAFEGAGLGNVVGFGGERSLGPSWTRFIGL